MALYAVLQGPPSSSASQLFSRSRTFPEPEAETDLLRSIRIALRGSGTSLPSTVHSKFSPSVEGSWGEDELIWNSHTVVVSSGGVIRKKWNFEAEGQSIQWACMGELEQTNSLTYVSSQSAPNWKSDQRNVLSNSAEPNQRPTFGPFTRAQQDLFNERQKISRVPAVFIFLRSIGKIFLRNGMDYTFSLPFIVRKAWALHPHGVMIQRVLEPAELEESDFTGDAVLPTIFSITSPFSEAGTVGLTAGIIGGVNTSVSLKDEHENSTRPLKSIPPTEIIVEVSRRGFETENDILVTVNPETRQLSVWRYVYIKPKDIPVPSDRTKQNAVHRRLSSISTKPTNRRHSALYSHQGDKRDRFHLPTDVDYDEVLPLPEPPLAAIPGMPPSLSTTTTMASLVTGRSSSTSQWSEAPRGPRNSLGQNDLSVTMDRMVLGGRAEADAALLPVEHGRMKASYWMERMYSQDIGDSDIRSWSQISVSFFDQRWDGSTDRCLMSISLPSMETLLIFKIFHDKENDMLKVEPVSRISATSAASIKATRENVWDLLIVKSNKKLALLTHGLNEISVNLHSEMSEMQMNVDSDATMGQYGHPLSGMSTDHGHPKSVQDPVMSSVSLVFEDGYCRRTTLNFIPPDLLTRQCLQVLARTVPMDVSFDLHCSFLEEWSKFAFRSSDGVEFECFATALYKTFELGAEVSPAEQCRPWEALSHSPSRIRFCEDMVLHHLQVPSTPKLSSPSRHSRRPHKLLAPVLYALHTLGEDLRLQTPRYEALLRLAPLICHVALIIRPEWADYWKRLCPCAMPDWPSSASAVKVLEHLDDRIPVWPPDISAILYGRISNPDWKVPWHDTDHLAKSFDIKPSFEYGHLNPLSHLNELTVYYKLMGKTLGAKTTQKRAENVIQLISMSPQGIGYLDTLPLGIAAPLREEQRTCQLWPPGNWPAVSYKAVHRDDLAASASGAASILFNDGYRSIKDFINPSRRRKAIGELVAEAKSSAAGEMDAVSGVELDLQEFTDIRFGQDRRLDEVARMLCSSTISFVKVVERPDLNEHDQSKEQQHQVIKIAERTLALPFGRAMFTFGSVPTVTREAYVIPKLEFTVRMQPMNITTAPEAGKIPPDCICWGEFHNGVAAGLRISPSSTGVESSWIAFNKPSELTPEHAGFLFGLGLTGHLKEMLTWHTFGYLTPKHDLTSIGVLLGLSAANIGSGDKHVTKLLAVHTPALLPTPTVDLNVSLMTQAAGLAGVGLLYMGTKNRRMAEVCLNQISRKDLVQPDLSNEHREAYTYSSALAFGMIMLGKGSSIPADMSLLSRLSGLIHGDTTSLLGQKRHSYDLNLTSPAATMSLGLMYLRTERQDIADVLTIPDTVIALNRIQPSFLLMRTVARCLILWNSIAPTSTWLAAQVPKHITKAMESRFQGRPVDDSLELAYYNILAGCCFVIGLKYAGTACKEAYLMIISYFDLFSRLVYSNGPAFDHRIKRFAVREGLNLISISLSMVMAGTGEITCLRRLRYAYGMYYQANRYGIHMATHMSLGLLFLGGGRFTLGTSDAAIASMVMAFFPRFHHVSSDNKSYLQALRHMWVLAVEPRCLVARDVDTAEVVYLPVKITMKEGNEIGATQLISPTLIPDLDKLLSIRVDTPRYWPFYLDIERLPQHKAALLRNQTLFVKRRTAFLSYTEDPRGCRSLFVRSGSSAGDAATLDFPQLTDTTTHPAGDLSQFITSFSNDVLFLAFADHFSQTEGETPEERLFHTYCHASLLDSILQDKPQTLQSHLTLYRYRTMSSSSQYFHIRLQDLRFAADFYGKIYDRRFSGRTENNPRPPLIRETTVSGALYALDQQLDLIRNTPQFLSILSEYASGQVISTSEDRSRQLAWYLLRNGVPVSTLLSILKGLARDAHAQCLGGSPPDGTSDSASLDQGIKEVLHGTGTKMTTALGSGWSVRSLDEIITAWKVAQ